MVQITPSERAVLQMLFNGDANHQIADVLCVEEHAVDAKLAALFARLGAATRREAVDIALRRGLVDPHNHGRGAVIA